MKHHVALIIETSSGYGRDLMSGIVRYVRMHDEWSVFLEQRDLWKKPPAWLSDWNGDGIISRVTTPKLLEAVSRTGVPLVELTDRHGDVSRSTLERQVRKYLGRTPQEEIRHVQIKRAQELMLTTDLQAEQIAIHCGFEYPEYFFTVFKRVAGIKTKEFRKQAGPK